MTSTERKRVWRAANPERSRAAERERAQARRTGYWGKLTLGGEAPRPCASQDSYYRYENRVRRMLQKINWPILGPGSMRMSREERHAAFERAHADAVAALRERLTQDLRAIGVDDAEVAHAVQVFDHVGMSGAVAEALS